MLNKEMSAGTNAEQSTNDETRLPSSPTIGNTNVVCSQSCVSIDIISVVLDELSPILNELNRILSKRNLTKKDISFSWQGNRITAFISCS